jgi:hypothetical protein
MLLGSVPTTPRNPRSSTKTQSARQSPVPATGANRRAPLHATSEPTGAVVAMLAQPWTGRSERYEMLDIPRHHLARKGSYGFREALIE